MPSCLPYISVCRVAIVLIITQLLFACSGPSQQNKNKEEKKTEAPPVVYKKIPSSFSDTLIIDTRSAVFYNPDSLQLEKIKATTPKNAYESDVHNCFYLMRNARIVLKKYWPRIHIVETSKARYLLFIKKNKSKICIDLDTKGDTCGIFLFDREQDPELCDMMNIDTALGFYFKK
jgi:hypothetical protein